MMGIGRSVCLATAVVALLGASGSQSSLESTIDPLAAADAAYAAGDVPNAVGMARGAVAQYPFSAAAAWRLSRALIAAGNLAGDEDTRHRLFSEARIFARRAVRADSTSAEAFTCLAVCQGTLSGLADGRRRIELAEEARSAAERALALNPDNGLAHLILGVWNREIASVGRLTRLAAKILYGGVPKGASLEDAEAHLRRAIALDPGRVNAHRELGITLIEMKRYDEAISAFAVAAGLSPSAPADSLYIADAVQRLARARDKWGPPAPR